MGKSKQIFEQIREKEITIERSKSKLPDWFIDQQLKKKYTNENSKSKH